MERGGEGGVLRGRIQDSGFRSQGRQNQQIASRKGREGVNGDSGGRYEAGLDRARIEGRKWWSGCYADGVKMTFLMCCRNAMSNRSNTSSRPSRLGTSSLRAHITVPWKRTPPISISAVRR